MKNLFKFSLALLMGAVMFAACSDDDSENIPEQNEVIVQTFSVTDISATIQCLYHPDKSVAYQLQIGNSVSEKYSKGQFLKVQHLAPGVEYTIKATIFDAAQKAIGMSKIKFKTNKSSSPEDMVSTAQDIVFEEVE